jgi:hypothetical protein
MYCLIKQPRMRIPVCKNELVHIYIMTPFKFIFVSFFLFEILHDDLDVPYGLIFVHSP